MFGGTFILHPNTSREERVENTIVQDGALAFMAQLYQGVALPGSFWMGLSGSTYEFDTASLTAISAVEPVGNGYLRQEIPRAAPHWVVDEVSGIVRVTSEVKIFATTADWNKVWWRMFLTDKSTAVDQTDGIVYSLSGATQEAQVVHAGDLVQLSYQFWWRR